MPHVSFVTLSGFRVRERQLLELGMQLPGLQQRAAAIGALPALGLLTLAGLTPEHWSCSYHAAPRCDEALVETLVGERPTFVAVSALTASTEEAYELCARLRAVDIRTAVGGLHASVRSSEAGKHADAVVVGEGELVWPRLLADAEADRLQPEYRPQRHATLECWPLPRFELLGADRPARVTLQTQRGCPLACEFCGASRLLGPFREKPLEAIRAELASIDALWPGVPIELADDNTFAGERCAGALLDLFADSPHRYFTEADWRIGLRPDVLSRLAPSGCVQVLTGVESLVFRYPGMGDKQDELKRMLEAVNAIQDTGVAVNGCFIVGADGETPASIDRLREFLLESPFAEIQLTLQTPFPGTQLHRRLRENNRLLPERGWPYYTLFDVTYRPDCMSVPELEAAFRELLQAVYSGEATRRRNRIRNQVWHANPAFRPVHGIRQKLS